jgi:hypothetical protein
VFIDIRKKRRREIRREERREAYTGRIFKQRSATYYQVFNQTSLTSQSIIYRAKTIQNPQSI